MTDWISTANLAAAAGVAEQRIRYVIAHGGKWRGAQLIVRTVNGRGGVAGKQYEIRVDSLPSALQLALRSEDTATHQRLGTRRPRSDRRQPRVVISKAWDGAVEFDRDTRRAIAAEIRHHVKRLWRSGYPLSRVLQMASEELLKATRNAGFDADHRELVQLCRLPRRFAEAERHYRTAHRYETDRKAHEDAKPRIRRTIEGMAPMQLVAGDVHHLDLVIAREDGTLATPKMVAWLDIGTGRIFASVFLFETGRAVTNAHVIAAFIAMAREWGLPQALYLDNGAEYNWAEFITDAMVLVGQVTDRESPIVRAMPYNAPAKAIENTFRVLEQQHFSTITGYIGGNRMATKTANVGRAPNPYPGTFDQLRDHIAAELTIFNGSRKRGLLNGRSPNELLAAAVEAGWSRIGVEDNSLRIAFSVEETREVTQGAISVRGQRWTCEELQAYLSERVIVLIPKYEDWSCLPLKDDRGEWLGIAYPDVAYHPLDAEGARDSKRRSRLFENAVRELGRAAPRIDVMEQSKRSAASLPPPKVPSAGVVSLNPKHAAIGHALAESDDNRRRRRQSQRDRDQALSLELGAEFDAKLRARRK